MDLNLENLFKPRPLKDPHWFGLKGKKKRTFLNAVRDQPKFTRHQGKREMERRMRRSL